NTLCVRVGQLHFASRAHGWREELLKSNLRLRLAHEGLQERHLAHAVRTFEPVAAAEHPISCVLATHIKRHSIQLPCNIRSIGIDVLILKLPQYRGSDLKACYGKEEADTFPGGARRSHPGIVDGSR